MCFSLDLSDMLSDEDEKENVSPDLLPTTVVVDCFGEIFEEAVRAMYIFKFVVFNIII